MEQGLSKGDRKLRLVFSAITLLVAAAGASGWLYYNSRLRDVPLPPTRRPQAVRPIAKIIAAPQPSATPSAVTDSEPSSPPSKVRDRTRFHAERDPIEEFRQDANNAVLRELGPGFPELRSVLSVQTTISNDARYRRVLFQLLDAAKDAPADRRPAMLFAADEVAQGIWCAFENKAECDQLRVDFARYQLTLAGAGLGGVFIYPHDLLWRLHRDYAETEWGKRAFVLLLNEGWDTSGTCQKGARGRDVVGSRGVRFVVVAEQRTGER